jgi:hypothetical protein
LKERASKPKKKPKMSSMPIIDPVKEVRERRVTEEGLKIYTEDELKMG